MDFETLRQKGFQKESRMMGIFELVDLFSITTEALRKSDGNKTAL